MSDRIVLTEQDHFDLWCGLTTAQKAALCVLADGREHYCWKRATDAEARVGRGAVNATAIRRLTTLKLARHTDYGGPFTGGTVVITDIGQAVWDASVFDAPSSPDASRDADPPTDRSIGPDSSLDAEQR